MDQNWQHKISNYSEAPPEEAWINIASSLDNEKTESSTIFPYKIVKFEIAPPASAKKNIFELLDVEESEQRLAARLYNYNQDAPTAAWPLIVENLQKEETRVISINSINKQPRIKIYWKVAAAAVLLTGTVLWLTRTPDTKGLEISQSKETLPKSQPIVSSSQDTMTASTGLKNKEGLTATVQNAAEKINAKTPVKINTNPQQSYVLAQQPDELAYNPALAKANKLVAVNGETPQDIDLVNTPNSYITITGPDGQSIRVSAKFSNLIKYLNNTDKDAQETLDIIIKESAQWRATFANWREKMTNNIMAPSLTNFMDIIELSNVVEDKH
jgi:hypothetical protein